ncbi:MAG: hypothetical protein RBU29_15415 [bacterium]|nr:hypothetical protein [bacterium]
MHILNNFLMTTLILSLNNPDSLFNWEEWTSGYQGLSKLMEETASDWLWDGEMYFEKSIRIDTGRQVEISSFTSYHDFKIPREYPEVNTNCSTPQWQEHFQTGNPEKVIWGWKAHTNYFYHVNGKQNEEGNSFDVFIKSGIHAAIQAGSSMQALSPSNHVTIQQGKLDSSEAKFMQSMVTNDPISFLGSPGIEQVFAPRNSQECTRSSQIHSAYTSAKLRLHTSEPVDIFVYRYIQFSNPITK